MKLYMYYLDTKLIKPSQCLYSIITDTKSSSNDYTIDDRYVLYATTFDKKAAHLFEYMRNMKLFRKRIVKGDKEKLKNTIPSDTNLISAVLNTYRLVGEDHIVSADKEVTMQSVTYNEAEAMDMFSYDIMLSLLYDETNITGTLLSGIDVYTLVNRKIRKALDVLQYDTIVAPTDDELSMEYKNVDEVPTYYDWTSDNIYNSGEVLLDELGIYLRTFGMLYDNEED